MLSTSAFSKLWIFLSHLSHLLIRLLPGKPSRTKVSTTAWHGQGAMVSSHWSTQNSTRRNIPKTHQRSISSFLESVDGFVTTSSVEIRGFPKFNIQKSRWQEFVLAVGNGSRRHIDLHVVGAIWNRRLVARFRIAFVPQVTIQNECTSLRSSRTNNNFRWCMVIWLVRDYFVER